MKKKYIIIVFMNTIDYKQKYLKYKAKYLAKTSYAGLDMEQVIQNYREKLQNEIVPDKLKGNTPFIKGIAIKLIPEFPELYNTLNENLQNDPEVIAELVKTGKLKNIRDELKQKPEFVEALVEMGKFEHIDNDLFYAKFINDILTKLDNWASLPEPKKIAENQITSLTRKISNWLDANNVNIAFIRELIDRLYNLSYSYNSIKTDDTFLEKVKNIYDEKQEFYANFLEREKDIFTRMIQLSPNILEKPDVDKLFTNRDKNSNFDFFSSIVQLQPFALWYINPQWLTYNNNLERYVELVIKTMASPKTSEKLWEGFISNSNSLIQDVFFTILWEVGKFFKGNKAYIYNNIFENNKDIMANIKHRHQESMEMFFNRT